MLLPVDTALGLSLVLLRSSALAVSLPALGDRVLPATARLATALVLGTAAWSAAGAPAVAPPADAGRLLLMVASETGVGLAAGLASRLVLSAAVGAGSFAALSMGLGFGALADPVGGANAPAVGRLLDFLALSAAVALGIHRHAVVWLTESFLRHAPGTLVDGRLLSLAVVDQALGSIALSVQLAFPAVGAVTLAHLALGLVNRTAPQLNLMSVGFSLSILAGGFALYLTAPDLVQVVARAAVEVLSRGPSSP